MKTAKIGLIVWLLLLSFGFSMAQSVQTVVIDAGHGGSDPGTLARSKHHKNEKHIALAIAMKVGGYIEKNYPDVKVIYTRKKDIGLQLRQRAKIANKANADLFISIHVDAVGNKNVSGASVYVLGLHRTKDNLKVAMRENAVMLQEDDYETNYAGFDPNDPESYIIFSLMQNQHLSNSMTMAGLVNKHLKSQTKRRTKGVKQAGFYVLREVGMPSILVETGYITNTSDANYLCSSKGQNQTALAIYKAFKEYKSFMEAHTTNLEVETENTEPKKEEENSNSETYFTVQVLYSGKDLPSNSKHFKGLSPIYKHKASSGYRYSYGKTQNYSKALTLQKEARKVIKGAYLVGYHNGKQKKAVEIRTILNANR